MDTLELIKELLRSVTKENREEVYNKVTDILLQYHKENIMRRKGEDPNLSKLIPIQDLLELAKEFDFLIPTDIIMHYSDESLAVFSASEESAITSELEVSKYEESEEVVERECSIAVPEEFGENLPVEETDDPFHEIFEKLYEEEEEFDSGKEFDDVREGDDEWTEPVYNTEDFESEATYYDRNSFRPNALQLIHSFGFDSYRRNNLCVINENTIAYISGNYVHIYDLPTRSFRYIRSSGGGGLGHFCKHPLLPLFAVGERGIQPLIIIYDYPSLKVVRVLRGGAEIAFNYLCFSPDGKWLLSQASKPDSSLTVWNWNKERIVLKQRNPEKEIWKAKYNHYLSGGIVTTGAENITFWRFIETFTGLKLIPSIGNWGEILFCDINTFCPLSEEVVICSNSNKNLFVWEENLLTMEVRRRNKCSLHDEDIVYVEFKERYDEIFTVGLEGKYKVWDYTRLERARIKNKEILELQPTFQRTIKDGSYVASPFSFERANISDPDSEIYYMQDRCGAIWRVELAVKENLQPSEVVFQGHDGPIIDVCPSPVGYYVATLGRGKKLHVYNSTLNKLIMRINLSVEGSSLLWLPISIDKTASLLIMGFVDGTIRVAVLSIRAREADSEKSDKEFINVIQALKPHNNTVRVLSADPHRYNERVIVSGSDDCRVFIYHLRSFKQDFLGLCPVGFVLFPCPIYSLTWNRKKDSFLITSLDGVIGEAVLPEIIPDPPSNTFEIKVPIRICNFGSVKSEVVRKEAMERNLKRKEKRRLHEEKKKTFQIELLKERRKKIDKLNEISLKILEERELEKVRLKEEKLKIEEAKKEVPKNPHLLLNQYYEYKSSNEKDTDDSDLEIEKKSLYSDFSQDDVFQGVDEKAVKALQDIVGKKKYTKGTVEEDLEKPIKKKTFEEIMGEVKYKIKEIKERIKSGEKEKNLDSRCEEPSIETCKEMSIIQDETGDEHEAKEYISVSGEKIILEELMKIMNEEPNFDDLEVLSEDEEVPPKHFSSGPVPIYFADYINEDCIWVSPGGYDAGYIYEYRLGDNVPYNCTPVTEFEDIEMSCFVYVNGGYFVVGQGNGFIKVISINKDNFSDFSNYWLYGMHDNFNGKIKKICLTYDSRFMYSIGYDSNIFYYKTNFVHTQHKEKRNLPDLMMPPSELKIDDTIEPHEPSLEESVKKTEAELLVGVKIEMKKVLKEKLENLANKFEILFSLNEGLPKSQKLPMSYFIINEEYNNNCLSSMLEEKRKATEDLELEYIRTQTIKNKVYDYFIHPIQTFKIYIYAHSFNYKVTTFYQAKLPMAFQIAEREIDGYMMDMILKGRKKMRNSLEMKKQPLVKKKYKRKDIEIRPFVNDEERILKDMPRDLKSLYMNISERRKNRKILQNSLMFFRDKSEDSRREFLNNMLHKTKPPKDKPFMLKSSPFYKPNQNIRKEVKFFQLVTTKRKIYNLLSFFNSFVLRAREMKSRAAAMGVHCLSDLKGMGSEFKNIIWPLLPQKVEIFEPLEFPENLYLEDPPDFPHDKKNIVCKKYNPSQFHQLYEINKKFPIDIKEFECKKSHGNQSQLYTPWEMEFILDRKRNEMAEYLRKKYTMDELLLMYDEEIRKLAFMKIEYELKLTYLRIIFLKYFEELQIVRKFQLLEDDIDEKCSFFIKYKHINILRINILKRRVKKCTYDIIRCLHRCQKISINFMKEIVQNPPSVKRFILKHFNRTWVQELKKNEPGASDDDFKEQEGNSSSSSDTDSGPPEPDEDEIDSDDIDRLVAEQQEEFIEVGKGETEQECEKELFDRTLLTREKRFVYEKQIAERKQEIYSNNDKIKSLREKVLMIQSIIAIFKVKKSLLVEEKYKELNRIRTVVVLDSSQMQHYDSSKKSFPPLKENIVFPLYTLKNLEAKKRLLKNKILSADLDKIQTLKHIKRVEMDIGHLKSNLQSIKDKIKVEKINKFGFDINLPQMEETILRRVIKDYKYDTFPFHMKFHYDITKLKHDLEQLEGSSTEHLKQNTIEQLKLSALLEQKRQYKEIMRKIEAQKKVEYLSQEEINLDIKKLENVLSIQEKIKENLMSIIKEMKSSGIPHLREKINVYKKKLTDELLEKENYMTESGLNKDSSSDEEAPRDGRKKPKKKEKVVIQDDPIKHFDSEESTLLKTPVRYKLAPEFNEDGFLMEATTEDEIKTNEEIEDQDLETDSNKSHNGE